MKQRTVLLLASRLLAMAGDTFSNHGCNDLSEEFWESVSQEEAQALYKAWHIWNGDLEDYDPNNLGYLGEAHLMAFLSDALKQHQPEPPKVIDCIVYQLAPNNTQAVKEFVEDSACSPACPGYGDCVGGYHPGICEQCNRYSSGLLPFVDSHGPTVTADWGDVIVKYDNGDLELIVKDRAEQM